MYHNLYFFKRVDRKDKMHIYLPYGKESKVRKKMKLLYQQKEIELKQCTTFISRLKGFMGKKEIHSALLFNHCNSIHTFFMKTNIAVIFCNKDNQILSYYQNVPPNQIIFPQKGATKTFELPVNYFNVKPNDRLEIKK